jgi:hypothetical protein
VALDAPHIFPAVFAGPPVRHLTGRNFQVAFDAGLMGIFSRYCGSGCGQQQAQNRNPRIPEMFHFLPQQKGF